MRHERAWAYAAFAIVCVVWGTTYLAIRIAVETIPPMLMCAIRFLIGGTVILGIARIRGERIPTDKRTLGRLALVGLLLLGGGNLSVAWAEQWVPSGMAALLVATAPFWMALIESFRTNGERVGVRGAIGLFVGFAGVAMLVTPRGVGGAWSSAILIGAITIQLGAFAWQFGSAYGKYNLRGVPLLAAAGVQMLAGGVFCLLAGTVTGEIARFSLTPRTLTALVYLTLFGSILAYSAYIFALSHMRTTHTSLYAYVNPVIAVFLGWLILDEPLTWVSIVAMVVILAGVALVQTSRGRSAVEPVIREAEPKAA